MRFCYFLLMLALFAPGPKASAEQSLTYPRPARQDSTIIDYPQALLKGALSAAGLPYKLQASSESLVQSRALKQLEDDQGIDVVWTMTSIEREKNLLPVRIPIYKGLYGWRLLLIKPQSQSLLEEVSDLSGLARLPLLQGRGWPDTHVLLANGLRVYGTPHIEGLFDMLQHDRGVAFPRSVLEIWREQDYYQHDLVVEKHLVLYYPTAMYFFFRKSDQKLATGVTSGLLRMQESGEFDRLFTLYHQHAVDKAGLAQRKVLSLWNPLLPQATPLEQERFWYRP
ncbi:hypothetical protein GCM10010982_21970 [Bowmanella pacifica]|uniref:Solute-binding protein family 3/N-terminal domain-containing protein n=2 Tax=Bowmanella pacifica TaxID=502051 RepID=A0A918DKC4_9ALTE|nr:hypothetical protein GCM10010982_21970 [Bowmanella pacifica]